MTTQQTITNIGTHCQELLATMQVFANWYAQNNKNLSKEQNESLEDALTSASLNLCDIILTFKDGYQ